VFRLQQENGLVEWRGASDQRDGSAGNLKVPLTAVDEFLSRQAFD